MLFSLYPMFGTDEFLGSGPNRSRLLPHSFVSLVNPANLIWVAVVPRYLTFLKWALIAFKHELESIYSHKRQNIMTKIDHKLRLFDVNYVIFKYDVFLKTLQC